VLGHVRHDPSTETKFGASMPNFLITGGAGHIGSALVRALAKDQCNTIVVADNLLTGSIERVPIHAANVRFARCDINVLNDIAGLFSNCRFDYVFHLAAVVGVRRTLAHPLWVLRDAAGIENVLNLSRRNGVKRVYYSSSSEVYGEPTELPQHEQTTPLNSRLPYAVVKNLGETYLRTYHREFGLGYVIFRFFNTYGPHQSEDFVVPRFVLRALRGEDIQVYGDGSQSRTFCYVDDNVEACMRAYQQGLDAETINIGSDHGVTIRSLAERVIAMTDSKSRLVFTSPLAEGDMRARLPDSTKMRRLLGRELTSIEEGLHRLVAHYRSSGAWERAKTA
jgi:UDP-glucuronate decarboxylase